MKISALSFSYAENSMQYRGILLLDHFLKFEKKVSLRDFEVPICYSNKPDGHVPKSVLAIDDFFDQSEALLFAIAEAGGHYSAPFKNIIDWLIVKYRFNSQLGKGYSLSKKPVYVVTFTPTHQNSGDRHFDMTRSLLSEKLGADVRMSHVFHKCWDKLYPKNYFFVADFCELVVKDIRNINLTSTTASACQMHPSYYDLDKWISQYEAWDEKWKT